MVKSFCLPAKQYVTFTIQITPEIEKKKKNKNFASDEIAIEILKWISFLLSTVSVSRHFTYIDFIFANLNYFWFYFCYVKVLMEQLFRCFFFFLLQSDVISELLCWILLHVTFVISVHWNMVIIQANAHPETHARPFY